MMDVFVVVIEVMVGAKLLFIQACRPAAGYVYWYRHQNCREYKVCAMRTLGRKRQRAKKNLGSWNRWTGPLPSWASCLRSFVLWGLDIITPRAKEQRNIERERGECRGGLQRAVTLRG